MKKILVIEDDMILRDNIYTFLKEEGFNTFAAPNGKIGVDIAHQQSPDLIVCDISMPVMDGYETFKTLQREADTSTIPFIFLTAKTQRNEIRKGMELGVDDYLVKPFNFDDLMNSVNARLSKQERILKITEDNYRIMIENSLMGVFILQDGKFVYANQKLLDITGLNMHELLGKTVQEFFSISQSCTKLEILHRIHNLEKICNEINYTTKTGKNIYLEMCGGPLKFNNINSYIISLLDITEKKNLEKVLYENMILTQEKERKKLAEELHDGLGPLLSTIKLYTENIRRKVDGQEEVTHLAELIDTLSSEAIDSSKEIANNLTPAVLDDYGLTVSLKKYIDKLIPLKKINIGFNTNFPDQRINTFIEISVYRIVTELINNTIKHAQADHINIELLYDGRFLQLSYTDDGLGYSTSSSTEGSGLNNIKGRIKNLGSKMDIISKEGEGVKVLIAIDLEGQMIN